MTVICPDCEVELPEDSEGCPNCGLSLFEIASRPRKRPKKKVKTITLYKLARSYPDGRVRWRIVSATYKDNPVNKILLEDPSGEFKYDRQVRLSAGSYGWGISNNPEYLIKRLARDLAGRVHNAKDALVDAEKKLEDFKASFPEWEPEDEEK